uniref:Uncharacterized protein n=1 Tax=viral metagenome TaxID=1070528 RepID=A0A6C0AYP7_9ZZZZ
MNKFFILVVAALLFYFIKKDKFKPTKVFDKVLKLYNGDEWADYRLGDIFYQPINSKYYDMNYEENILYHKTKYPGTIANEYINKNTSDKNYKLLKQIIESKVSDKNTYPDTLFLHIRIGEVMCHSTEWLDKVNGPLYYSKVGDTVWWDNILDYIKSNGIKKVVIVSGAHINTCLSESSGYLEERKQFLEKNGLETSYRLAQSPDQDILMSYYVKHFISTGGGFGKLIKEIKIK